MASRNSGNGGLAYNILPSVGNRKLTSTSHCPALNVIMGEIGILAALKSLDNRFRLEMQRVDLVRCG